MPTAYLIDAAGHPVPYHEPKPGVYIPLDYQIHEADARVIAERICPEQTPHPPRRDRAQDGSLSRHHQSW